jgi:hypothetical protein
MAELTSIIEKQSRFDETEYLVVKDILQLWLYRHGWERPGLGWRETNEALAASSIYELAERWGSGTARSNPQELRERLWGCAEDDRGSTLLGTR